MNKFTKMPISRVHWYGRHAKHVAIGLLVLVAASPAYAQNLLANSNFDSDLSGWTPRTTGSATATYSADSGSPNQGSVHLSASNGDSAQLNQCVAISATNVDLIAREYITASSAVQGAAAEVIAYDQPNCTGNPVGVVAANPVPVSGFLNGAAVTGWNEISALNQNISNDSPVSALVSLFITASAGGTADYYFDDVRFGPTGTTPVRLQSFDVQ
jgi:hypothetical protein